MPIKNYTTKVPAAKTVGEIQAILARHCASRIMLGYDDGRVSSVCFAATTSQGMRSFRLPARVESVQTVLGEQGVKSDYDHAERVAWRNVKDWIDAQMAMVETDQAELAEVFMPYMLDSGGLTMYEAYNGRMLGCGDGGADGR